MRLEMNGNQRHIIKRVLLIGMSTPKTQTKFVIHHKPLSDSLKSRNMFLQSNKNPTALENLTIYSIVGDRDFKEKYYRERSSQSMIEKNTNCKTLEDTQNTTFCHFDRSLQNKTILSKLSLDRKLEITHDERTMAQIQLNKSRDRKIELHLKRKSKKHRICSTVTYGSVQQIYAHPNPEKIELINDNIPEFWKNSLRDNDKRLKRHLKGQTFRQEVAEQMLQTLKGRKMLEASVPKVKEEFLEPPCSKAVEVKFRSQRRKGFSLMGKKAARDSEATEENYSTINIERSLFDEVHKVQYDAGRKWKGYEE